MKAFEKGDRIVWLYEHQIGRSRFLRAKRGVYIRSVNPKGRIKGTGHTHYAMVLFDGNKSLSKIPKSDLKYEQMTKKIYRG